MSHLMRLAEALRDIAEECSRSEIEQAIGLCIGFADRVSGEPVEAAEYPGVIGAADFDHMLRASKLKNLQSMSVLNIQGPRRQKC